MQLKNTSENYGAIAITLHWLMAILILGLICLGFYIANTPFTPDKLKLFGLHKEFGILVLALVMFRILWRIVSLIPKLPDTLPPYQRRLASLVHYALYGFMIIMPLSGWMMSSAAGFPVSFFGIFTLPDLVSANPDLQKIFGEIHEISAYALVATLLAHISAAFIHHFVYKDNILRRILPWKNS